MFCHCFFIFLQDSNTNKGLTDETGYLHEHTKLLLFSQTLQMFRKGHILTNYQMTLSQYSFFQLRYNASSALCKGVNGI